MKLDALFINKLLQLDVAKLPISEYNKAYLFKHQKHAHYHTYLFSSITQQGLQICKKEKEEIVLVDFGGGTGLLSIYAKLIGFGKVIYNDIYDVSCKDAYTIASAFGVIPDAFWCGDETTLISNESYLDLIISMDVIEHIYNPEIFIKNCYNAYPNLSMVHLTGANPFNNRTIKKLRAVHLRNENIGYPDAIKPRDTKQAFLEVRKEFISSLLQKEPENLDVVKLAKATRGKILSEIPESVAHWQQTGIMPKAAVGTNTCDPHTGNWSERIIFEHEWREWAKQHSISVAFKGEIYDPCKGNIFRKWFVKILNLLLKIHNKVSCRNAPLIMILIKKQ